MAADRGGTRSRAVVWLALVATALPLSATAQPDLLAPERAFEFSARAMDARTVEAQFAIAKGYYLYRDKLKFSVEPMLLTGSPRLPPGKVKVDEFFGEV
jgi:thioredoxin:protein disulfide reductase